MAFAAVAGLGAVDGGYFPGDWGLATLAFTLVAASAVLIADLPRPARLELAFLGCLAALALWALLSTTWSPGATAQVLEAERGMLYVAAAAAAILLLSFREAFAALLGGILAGAVAVALYALGTRLFPGDVGGAYDPSSGYQLAEPLGYWNALGILDRAGDPSRRCTCGARSRTRDPSARVGIARRPAADALLHILAGSACGAGRRCDRPDRGRRAPCAAARDGSRGRNPGAPGRLPGLALPRAHHGRRLAHDGPAGGPRARTRSSRRSRSLRPVPARSASPSGDFDSPPVAGRLLVGASRPSRSSWRSGRW